MASTTSSIVSMVISHTLSATATATSASSVGAHGGPKADNRPTAYKAAGLGFAIASGIFIGVSFVLKKKGLLQSNLKEGTKPGEGVAYLKNGWWWTGMILMILGEVFNFIAYAFVDAILVTPLGALSVVVTAILSSIFLKERLSFVGKIGCFVCIIGAIIIALSAPEQSSAATIQDMKTYVLSPGFLSYAGVLIVGSAFVAIWAGPRYGDKSMMVYLTVCSLIGSLSVVATQGLGAAVLSQIAGKPQFNQWFLYVLLVFIIITLLTEIYYLNKALNIFNAALVTPTYYVFFTSSTIVTSAVLFRGFKGSPTAIATLVMGFFEICSGVILLQLSKSAKDVPDTAIFRGDLDQVSTMAEQEEPESEPRADTIRGTAALIRRLSTVRQTAEAKEAAKIRKERLKDLRGEDKDADKEVEWDGLRRRVTFVGEGGRPRRNTSASQHAWSGLSTSRLEEMEEGRVSSDLVRIPTHHHDPENPDNEKPLNEKTGGEGTGDATKQRVKHIFVPKAASHQDLRRSPVGTPLPDFHIPDSASGSGGGNFSADGSGSPKKSSIAFVPTSPTLKPSSLAGGNRERSDSGSTYMSGGLRPSSANTGKKARRQFSFQTLFSRHHHHPDHEQVEQEEDNEDIEHSALPSPSIQEEGPSNLSSQRVSPNASLLRLHPVPSSGAQSEQSPSPDDSNLRRFQTEEERLGLVSGDASSARGSISSVGRSGPKK